MNEFRMSLGIPKPEKEPASIDEMRQVIDRAGRDSSLIHNALTAAQYKGMSGEDKYVLLAYSALRELERHYQANVDWLMTHPQPGIIVPKSNS
jgi:hypothetical protein